MNNRYNQGANYSGATRFTQTPISEVEFSKMQVNPSVYTAFNGGDIVPIYCQEVLPHSTFSIDFDSVIRLTSATRTPVMGHLYVDYYAFFVPNRVVNESWRNVLGENTSGFWTAPEVDLVKLYRTDKVDGVQVPVGSVADYYGFPTQTKIVAPVLQQCNDLKFRGYLSIYNEYFRSQNYMPPIGFSKLNLYNGFFEPTGSYITLDDDGTDVSIDGRTPADGSTPDGAVFQSIYGYGERDVILSASSRLSNWSALDKPLKACKLHDAFTSVLPSPQKGPSVYFGVGTSAPIVGGTSFHTITGDKSIKLLSTSGATQGDLWTNSNGTLQLLSHTGDSGNVLTLGSTNAIADLTEATGVTVNDLRTAVATQQVYEALARGGSRYWSMLKSFFQVEVDNPFPDIPTELGHIRRELDFFQVAQTSATQEGSTTQGNLTAFGYTSKGGSMFTKTFLEHGYIHMFAVVRQRNLYSTYLSPDNFRTSTLDFYLPQLANIGEQPIRTAVLNPFTTSAMETALGYQEAWWEYRYEPDRVTGVMRSGLEGSLDVWHFGDPVLANLTTIDANFLYANTQKVLDRVLFVTSEHAPQFIMQMSMNITKQLPMPVYSVPGLDII